MEDLKLIDIETISSRRIKQIKSPFERITVKKGNEEKYINDGWEIVKSKLKHSIRLEKPKVSWIAFEDRVWGLIAEMGFKKVNTLRDFKINYAPGLTKQIDVFAFDDEIILIIECKSTEERKRISYQKEINELIGLKDKLRDAAKSISNTEPKVAFIFATNNAILNDSDRLRIKDAASSDNFFHFNQDTIEYYEQLTKLLGYAAKYQLFGHLFEGQKIPGLDIKVPAICGKFSPGYNFVSFCIDPYELLKLSYILHRSDSNTEASKSYQRLVNKTRINNIGKYIDNDGYFPNSIIANIDAKKLNFSRGERIDEDCSLNYGILTLPRLYKSIFIIDGQHRLYGYAKSSTESHHTIQVVAFHNLDIEEQTNIFVDINHTQKSVPANLLQSIMADYNWNSKNDKKALSALKTRLLVELNSEDDSALYKRIILSEEKKTDTRCLTLKTIKDWGMNRISLFGKLKGDHLIKSGRLSHISHIKTLEKSKSFFKECFNFIESMVQEQWNKGSGEGGFVSMNVSISAFIRLFEDLIEYQVFTNNIVPEEMSGIELADSIKPMLEFVTVFVENLSDEDSRKLRSKFGSGATEKVLREYQNAIYSNLSDFKPDGIEQWVKENSGMFNSSSKKIGDRIQIMIREHIFKNLEVQFGKKSWWFQGIPKEIQKKCSEKVIDNNHVEPTENYLLTLDYQSIIMAKSNKQFLLKYYTKPGDERVRDSDKLNWFVKFNTIRNKFSHPEREKVTEEEFNFMQELENWLSIKLNS
jgi:DNA sulfur modification protein DndB